MDVVATGSLDSVRRDVDSFLLSLPLGTDRDSADVEEAVARRLISCEIERLKLQKKLHQWVQVATELYHVVEENSAYDQNFAHRMESPSAFFASGMVDRMRSDRHLIDAHSVESSSHNGAQVILWKEQNHPRSFAEAQGVLSDVHNLKKEVADLKRKIWIQNQDPQYFGSQKMLLSTADQQVATSIVHKCECCVVLRTQLDDQLQQLTSANEEKSNLRRSLLDAEIELQKLTASGDSISRQLQESEASNVHLKSNHAKMIQDMENERSLHNTTQQKLYEMTQKVRCLEEAEQTHKGGLQGLQQTVAKNESKEASLLAEIDNKSKQIQELKAQLADLMQRIADLEGEFSDREAATHAEQTEELSRVHNLQNENKKLVSDLQAMEANLLSSAEQLAEVALQQNQDKVLQSKVDELENRLRDREERLELERSAYTDQKEAADKLQDQINKLEAVTLQSNAALQDLKIENSCLNNKLQLAKDGLHVQHHQKEEDALAIARLEQCNESLEQDIALLSEKTEGLQRLADSLQKDLQSKEDIKVHLEELVDRQNKESGKLRANVAMRDCELKSLSATIEALQEELVRQKASVPKKQTLELQHQLGLANEKNVTLEYGIQQGQEELSILRAEIAGLERHLAASDTLTKELEKRLAVVSQSALTKCSTPEGESSMRRLQGLLYSREKDLRRAQLKVEDLQGRLAWWENTQPSTTNEELCSSHLDTIKQSHQATASKNRLPSFPVQSTTCFKKTKKASGRSDSSDSD